VAKEIGLREMAKKIGVSPTYLSKVERDEFSPPTEEKVRKIAVTVEPVPVGATNSRRETVCHPQRLGRQFFEMAAGLA
jgi:transcriptional regulator with XRE-family HTH domain